MPKVSRSKLGRKNAGMTKNQRRKLEYKRQAAEDADRRAKGGGIGKHARRKLKRKVRLVGTAVHRVPCGNYACVPCRDA